MKHKNSLTTDPKEVVFHLITVLSGGIKNLNNGKPEFEPGTVTQTLPIRQETVQYWTVPHKGRLPRPVCTRYGYDPVLAHCVDISTDILEGREAQPMKDFVIVNK